eukprot:5033051-Alexandrium_andersonii.AAC.1
MSTVRGPWSCVHRRWRWRLASVSRPRRQRACGADGGTPCWWDPLRGLALRSPVEFGGFPIQGGLREGGDVLDD